MDGITPLRPLEAAHAAFCNPANRGYSIQAAIGAYHARIIGQKAIGSEEPLDPTALYTACEVMLAVLGDQAALPEDYANEVSAAIRAYLATSRALAPLPAPMPGDMAETIALIRKRMKSGECDLRDVGRILTGRWDQGVPAAILAAAAAAPVPVAVKGLEWQPFVASLLQAISPVAAYTIYPKAGWQLTVCVHNFTMRDDTTEVLGLFWGEEAAKAAAQADYEARIRSALGGLTSGGA